MRWLVVSPYLPHSRVGHGGGTAVFQACRALARVHETSLLCLRREDEDGLERELVEAGVSVRALDFRSERARGRGRLALIADRALRAANAARRGRPLMVEKYDRATLHAALRQEIAQRRPDVVQIEYGFMAPYARTASAHSARPHVLLNTHEIGTLVRLRRLARASGPARRRRIADLSRWAAHEAGFGDVADTIGCVTDQDRVVLGALTDPSRLVTLPLGTDVDAFEPIDPAAAGPRLLFVGSFAHPPNVEGLWSFLERDFARVRAARPDAVLDVVGAGAPDALRAVAAPFGDAVRWHGFVDDLDAVFREAAVVVVPLVSGGGIKIKVLEAMGRGAAVVSTPIGLEGIDDEGAATRRVGADGDFAGAVVALLDDAPERGRLGKAARAWIAARFDWNAIVERMTARVQSSQAAQGGTGRDRP